MFYSVAIPDILLIRPIKELLYQQNVGVTFMVAQRAYASMTAKKPIESQSASSGKPHPANKVKPFQRNSEIAQTSAYALPVDAHTIDMNNREQETVPLALAVSITQLYERFRRPIHSYIYRLLGTLEDADDITQEVFIRAYTAWDNLYDRDNLSAWLYRIATNLCVDLLRRRKRISLQPLGRPHHNNERFDDGMDDAATFLPSNNGGIPEIAERDHIRLALARLPEEYAVALVLSAAQGVPYQEIALIVGISPNAAATRISRAKRMFIEQYRRLNFEDAEK